MKIAKASLVSPDRNFWYGADGGCRFDLRVRLLDLFGQISVLAYYALWLPLILVDYRQTLGNYAKFHWIVAFAMFACLSVFWSAAPAVTARAGVAAAIARRLRADRRPHSQHPDVDARHR